MSFAIALAALLAAPTTMPPPPPGLQFGFFRMVAFRQRAKELGCGAGDLDAEFEAIRKKLAKRYGKKPFSMPKVPYSGPGECAVVVPVYHVNLADFRRQAEAALAAPAPSTPTQGE
ncbi:MAG TPA: hypothetical protein VGD66_06100 [Allosphingosinicella sp.]|jgi:hypothetical protein